MFLDEALADVAALDAEFKRTGKLSGPFHGLSIAMKDNFMIRGQPTTVGMTSLCEEMNSILPSLINESSEGRTSGENTGSESVHPSSLPESIFVTILRRLGAVLYVKTNVAPAMIMPETVNHVFGRTVNPHNRLLGAGGSSGGASALAAVSNVISILSDVGGSIRMPASFMWVYSLKPMLGRFPTYGGKLVLSGFELACGVNGPICSDLTSLEFYCRHIVNSEPWMLDPKMVEIPW